MNEYRHRRFYKGILIRKCDPPPEDAGPPQTSRRWKTKEQILARIKEIERTCDYRPTRHTLKSVVYQE